MVDICGRCRGAVLVVLSAVFLVRLVNAAPVPSVSFTEVDETPMIGEQTTFTLRFNNSGDQAGFGPYVDLVLPEDFSNPSVSYLGQSVTVQPIGPFPAGVNTCLNHPLAKQSSGAPVEVCLNPTKENRHSLFLSYPSARLRIPNRPQIFR